MLCPNVMDKGYKATVYNRSQEKARPLLDAGAAWADTPRAVAERADVIFAIVGFPRDVREVFIATNMIGVCEALLYGYKAGLDLKTVLQSVGGGAAASWSLNNLGPRIIDRNFEPGFFVEHFIKDMGIALDEARRMNLALPGLALANQLYAAVKAQGYGRKGTQALMLALEHLSNINR